MWAFCNFCCNFHMKKTVFGGALGPNLAVRLPVTFKSKLVKIAQNGPNRPWGSQIVDKNILWPRKFKEISNKMCYYSRVFACDILKTTRNCINFLLLFLTWWSSSESWVLINHLLFKRSILWKTKSAWTSYGSLFRLPNIFL